MQKQIIHFFSQWRVIIPLAIIVLIWMVWPQRTASLNGVKSSKAVPTTTKSPTAPSILSLFGAGKKLSCSIASATAVIDDSRITATITQDNKKNRVVFDGDCLYRWIDGSKSGERSCGLKSYLPFVSQFASNDSLKKLFPQTDELASACKEVNVIDEKKFEIPKSVLFKNVSLKF